MSRIQQLWAAAETASKHKDWETAAARYESIIAIEPGHVPALLKASKASLRQDHYRRAHERLFSALAHSNGHPGLVLELARQLRQFHEAQTLLEMLHGSNFARCDDPGMLTEMSLLVSSLGDQATALGLVDRALKLNPQYAQASYLRGTLHMFLGDMDRAEADLEQCIRLQPRFPQAHWVLSSVKTWTSEHHHVARLREIIGRSGSDPAAQSYLYFALHNELHGLERFDESWDALERGCRAKRDVESYDDQKTADLFAAIEALCTPEFIADRPPMANPEYTPIFILGMHRSGTTLLERILGGHSAVSDGGETYAFTAQIKLATDHKCLNVVDMTSLERLAGADFEAMGQGFLRNSRWRAKGRPFLTEKLPPNFIVAGFIAKALPNARILHMVRDPMDTCFSNLRTFFTNAAAYSNDQTDMARYYARYRGLMAHWRSAMPGRILDISYDALVQDTEATARSIFDFCGLPYEAEALAVERKRGAVSTASSAHVRQGILKNRGGSWRAYEQYLDPLRAELSAAGIV
jgi:tetratricopeptide (TPR) repeat protein